MIPVPTPPTDNLYKFAALFGLAVALAAGGSAAKLASDRDSENRSAEVRALTAIREADRLSRSTVTTDRERAVALADSVRRLVDSVEAAAERRAERPSYAIPLLIFGAVLGTAISGVGFTLWYQRHQRYQDQAVRRDAMRSGSDRPVV